MCGLHVFDCVCACCVCVRESVCAVARVCASFVGVEWLVLCLCVCVFVVRVLLLCV